jgi:hypothetical protein
MRAFELLTEEQFLSVPKLIKDLSRFNNLIKNIKTGNPLYLSNGDPIVISPKEATRLQDLFNTNQLTAKTAALAGKDGKIYPLSSFLKTIDYGGHAIPPGQEKLMAPTKEGAKLKPKDIGLHDKQIKASNLGAEIASNASLQSSEPGKVVINLSKQITAAQVPTIQQDQPPAIVKAINDYAGEYLGVWALINGHTDFPNKNKFLEWLNSPIANLTLFFPSESNNSIADSYALVDPKSGHQINISSKGKGGGAPPAISGLKIPDHVSSKSQYDFPVKFIQLMQNKSLPKPTTISQAFQAMNLIHEFNPKAIPPQFKKFLPWNQTIINEVNDSLKNNTPLPQYQSLWSNIIFKKEDSATDGGKLTHAVKNAVKETINAGGIPEFEAAVLEILDYNFIQQDTVVRKGGQMYFKTNWPAKINGRVTVETKSGAGDPTKGSFSFKLHFN